MRTREDSKINTLYPTDQLETLMTERNPPCVRAKLKRARVAIAGLGGLGSNVAVNLARAGVGFLHLVDFDVVEPSNLNRQHYRLRHLGLYKADALKQELAEINPFVTVVSECIRITKDNVVSLFGSDDIICEAFDDPAAKAMLVNKILTECAEKPLVAASGIAGYGSCNDIRTRKISDRLYVCGDGKSAATADIGLMASRVIVCAGHQSNMIIRLILGEKEE